MAVLITVEIPGGDPEEAKKWEWVQQKLRSQPGFIFHADGPSDGGWQLVEAWESEADYLRFFETTIEPNLPPDAPKGYRSQELAGVVKP
jgi:hypothetical protein